MAAKKTPTTTKKSSSDPLVQMQKIAADTQIKLQQMTDASSAKTFKYNADEAKKSRDWQTQMSNTSHQREVKDLVAAGLNPVLSSGGSGAQSYTTSSASGQADNAASAVAQLTSSRLAGIAGIEESNISAKATRAAAATSARAMRAAAAASAAAQRYAANLDYARAKYQADKQYQTEKYKADLSYKTAMQKPVSSVSGLIDKYFGGRNGDPFNTATANFANFVRKAIINRKPEDYFRNGYNSMNNYKLNATGRQAVSLGLKKLNLTPNKKTTDLFVRSVWFGDRRAGRDLAALAKAKRLGSHSARTIPLTYSYQWKTFK